ncbi:uncharacterized protein LODBEIA_P42280 [Lodderomyces beijingensis]|uniref:pyridoxal kinase n=1 Tax=Lodderomyces beijingensis TaxID=1775926 RepID=A0ABP0ZPC6_9ASCO
MKTLLSISSHVVHGYVGNRAITFPLQYMGWDVDAINTTNFSNHPGYGSFQGSKASEASIEQVIHGLAAILDLGGFDLILTGYCPNADVLLMVKEKIVEVLSARTSRGSSSSSGKPHWVVDPVLGDNGKLYVSEEVIPVYKEILSTGLVSLITPNQFEFETLSGSKISDWPSCKDALERFSTEYQVANIVISSVAIENQLYCVAYSSPHSFSHLPIKRIDCHFNGCGDLFTALVADEFHNDGHLITPQGLAKVLSKLHNILKLSYDIEVKSTGQAPKLVKDIKLVAAKDFLLEE